MSGLLAAYVLTRRVRKLHGAGKVLALASGALFIKRAATGHSAVYEKLGVSSAGLDHGAGINVERSITIGRPREEIYEFLRDLSNLPLIFTHMASVSVRPDEITHWVVEGPGNTKVEWDVRLINERKNEYIAWRSTEDASVQEAGSVHLRDAGDLGTEVRVKFRYTPPAGGAGFAAAKLLNPLTSAQVGADLRNLKQLIETGVVVSNEGQPVGPPLKQVESSGNGGERR
jgi:uncharacterized membrane protein